MLGGLIAGAIGGGAKSLSDMAEGQIEDKRKADLTRQLADIEIEKTQRIEEWRSQHKRDNMVLDAQATADAADVTDQRNIERNAKLGKRRAEVNAGNAAETINAENTAGLPELKANQNKRIFDAGKAERDAKVNEDLTNAANPKRLAVLAAEAKAKHVEGRANNAAAALSDFRLGQEKQIAELRVQMSKLPKDSPERETLQQRINDLSGGMAKGDTLAQHVGAARAILNDDNATDDEKEAARSFLGTVVANENAKRGGSSSSALPQPKTQEDFAKLPSGTQYKAPDGTIRTKK